MARNKKRKKIKQPVILSPANYIKKNARKLPIYKSFVNKTWDEGGLANVCVLRKHSNENITFGLFLVDLACKGLKDTMFQTNIPEDTVMKMLAKENFIECDYVLAHNIIYEGIEYGEENGFAPHKDFKITKYILENEDDVEYMDIPTGDEDGKPLLIEYNPIIARKDIEILNRTVGEGNFNVYIDDDMEELDGYDDEFDNINDSDKKKLLQFTEYLYADATYRVSYQMKTGNTLFPQPTDFDFDKIIQQEVVSPSLELQNRINEINHLLLELEDAEMFDEGDHEDLFDEWEEKACSFAKNLIDKDSSIDAYKTIFLEIHDIGETPCVFDYVDRLMSDHPENPIAWYLAIINFSDEKLILEKINNYKYLSISNESAVFLIMAKIIALIRTDNMVKAIENYLVLIEIFESVSVNRIFAKEYERILKMINEGKMNYYSQYYSMLSNKEQKELDKKIDALIEETLDNMEQNETLDDE